MFRKGREAAAYPRPLPLDADRLAVEAARRDPLRFETLYRKYVAQVYSFALYETRAHHAAEDITEQVFLQALRGLPDFDDRGLDEGSTFRVWLFQICRNVLANERRRDRRHPEAPLDLALNVHAADDPAATVAARDEAARAWRADRAACPATVGGALVLRFVEEMSAREIGEVMGRSEGAVRVLIHRALRDVADQLGGTAFVTGRPDDEDAIQLDLYLDRILAGDAVLEDGWLSGPGRCGRGTGSRSASPTAPHGSTPRSGSRSDSRVACGTSPWVSTAWPAAGGVLVPFGPASATRAGAVATRGWRAGRQRHRIGCLDRFARGCRGHRGLAASALGAAGLMPVNLPFRPRRDSFPPDLWTQCPSCAEMLYNKQLEKSLRVCSRCGHHFRLRIDARLALLLDDATRGKNGTSA